MYLLNPPAPQSLLAHTDTQPIHHCELFDHLTKYSVARTSLDIMNPHSTEG